MAAASFAVVYENAADIGIFPQSFQDTGYLVSFS